MCGYGSFPGVHSTPAEVNRDRDGHTGPLLHPTGKHVLNLTSEYVLHLTGEYVLLPTGKYVLHPTGKCPQLNR